MSAVIPNVGSFQIDTRIGTLTGTVTGDVLVIGSPMTFDFVLTPTAGTRAFTHQRPVMNFVALWTIGDPSGSPFTATITVS